MIQQVIVQLLTFALRNLVAPTLCATTLEEASNVSVPLDMWAMLMALKDVSQYQSVKPTRIVQMQPNALENMEVLNVLGSVMKSSVDLMQNVEQEGVKAFAYAKLTMMEILKIL